MRTYPLVALAFLTACTGRLEPFPPFVEGPVEPTPDPVVVVDCEGLEAVQGPLVLERGSDADALDGVLCVDGDIILKGVTTSVLELSSLQRIRGDLVIGASPGIERFLAPNLRVIDGELRLIDENFEGNPSLRELSLPLLERTAGLRVIANPEIIQLNLPELTSVSGSVSIVETTHIETLRLPRLIEVAGDLTIPLNGALGLELPELLSVGGNLILTPLPIDDTLRDISAPLLESVGGDLYIAGNTLLESVDLPDLTYVGGNATITGNASLPEIALPALGRVDGNLTIRFHTRLTTLDLDNLASVGGDVSVRANDALPDCLAQEVIGAMDVSGSIEIGDNRAGCDCSVEPITCL